MYKAHTGYHSALHQLVPIQILQLAQACEPEEKAQLMKMVMAHDLANSGATHAHAHARELPCLAYSSAEIIAYAILQSIKGVCWHMVVKNIVIIVMYDRLVAYVCIRMSY